MTLSIPDISIVIPAYNEGERIGATVLELGAYLQEHGNRYEIIIVDDGSPDDTVAVVEKIRRNLETIRLISYPVNQGKGHAVKIGVLAAQYDLILVTDADLSTPIGEIDKLLPYREEADVVIGSRAVASAELRRQQALPRRFLGKTFNSILRLMCLTRFNDTQCGFKLWHAATARHVFAQCKIKGFAGDVEALLLAETCGYRIKEVGVVWENADGSKVRIMIDAPGMLCAAIFLFLRIRLGLR